MTTSIRTLRAFYSIIAVAICIAFFGGAMPLVSAAPPTGIPSSAVPLKSDGEVPLVAWVDGNHMFVPVNDSTTSTQLTIPRLANVAQDVQWLSEESSRFSVQSEPNYWVVNVGKAPENKPAVVQFTLDSPARVFDVELVTKPTSENMILLPAQMAITRGEKLRFEPQPHKNTVGYWANEKDTAEWKFEVKEAGTYGIDILQGCGTGHGGSTVALQVASSKLTFEVQETGHFQNFIWRTLGSVQLPVSEKSSLRLVPLKKAGGAVMDVRAVRLSPVGAERSFASELADPDALPKTN